MCLHCPDSLRVEAGCAQVFMALLKAERAGFAEIRAERDQLAAELMERRGLWLAQALGAVLDHGVPRHRPF